ncbi:MAG TPA: hypothetical protein VF941_03100 [Clostridia bacterium]
MKITIIVLVVIIIFLEGVRIDLLNDLAVPLDSRWNNLQEEIRYYHNQNLLLEDQLLHLEALSTIYWEARKKGFIPAKFISF